MPLDFPSSPTNGQQYQGYVYDATRQVWSHFDYLSGTSLLGTIYAWPLDDIPAWALELNGQAVSRTTYSGLFALLGTIYGAGDGSTTFNLPDYRGRTLVGENSGTFANVGTNVGSETTSIPNHTHQHISPVGLISGAAAPISPADDDLQAIGSYGLNGIVTAPRGTVSTASGTVERYTVTSSASGAATPNIIQPSTVVKWIICATTSTGDFNTEVQTALVTRVSDTPLSQNFILNGAFDVWQRGTSIVPSSTVNYSADRWESYRGSFASGLTVMRVGITPPTGFEFHMRVTRDSGNTSLEPILIAQPLETQDSVFLAGQTVTFSYYARKAADFSSSGNVLTASIITGTGTDQNLRSGFTGQATAGQANAVLTDQWQRFSVTATLPTTTNQVAVSVRYTPTGTAGAADRFDLAGVQLELGDAVTPFRRAYPALQGELAACQRYYYRVSSAETGDAFGVGLAATTTTVTAQIMFPATMRVPPTLDSSAASGFEARTATTLTGSAIALASAATSKFYGYVDLTVSGATAGQAAILRSNTSGATTAYLGFNAEL